jgi:hypothetical protein
MNTMPPEVQVGGSEDGFRFMLLLNKVDRPGS